VSPDLRSLIRIRSQPCLLILPYPFTVRTPLTQKRIPFVSSPLFGCTPFHVMLLVINRLPLPPAFGPNPLSPHENGGECNFLVSFVLFPDPFSPFGRDFARRASLLAGDSVWFSPYRAVYYSPPLVNGSFLFVSRKYGSGLVSPGTVRKRASQRPPVQGEVNPLVFM